MKHKAILAGVSAAILGGAVFFSGCSGSTMTFEANWYGNTSITTSISGTEETLTYSVTHSGSGNKYYSVSYGESTYTVNLTNATYSYGDGTQSENAYLLTGTLRMNVTYTVGEKSESYADEVTSKVYFSTVDNALRPMYSYKEFSCHSPTTEAPASYAEAVKYYHYSFETKYDSSLSTATLSYKKLSDDESSLSDSTADYNISSSSYTYLDNEELLFAIRGMTVSSSSSSVVRVLNASRSIVQEIKITNNGSSTGVYKFDMGDGVPEDGYSITANEITILANTVQSGNAQTAYYAVASSDGNTYRGVMLSLSSDLPYSLGTLTYTLEKASFTSK